MLFQKIKILHLNQHYLINKIFMFQNEYRQVNKNSSFIADFGFVKIINHQQQIKKKNYHIYFSKFKFRFKFKKF